MCGICGMIQWDGRSVDLDKLKAMNGFLIHRGPDGEGYYSNTDSSATVGSGGTRFEPALLHGHLRPAVGLAHRRLAIIDLATGNQPMPNEDGTVWVVFNGEIYNFQELRRELERLGHAFRTRSDTEVIVHGWEQWGEKAVERFRGMFAFALWDERRHVLYMARDRVGKKPLYYVLGKNRLLFASELKAIVQAFHDVPRVIDSTALDAYLSYGYVPSPHTIFQHVRKLEPAQWAVCTATDFRVQTYWRLTMEGAVRNVPEREVAEELRALFDEAVRLRLISDVPLGAFLSGGVDSSAVVASMAVQNPGDKVKTCSIGFHEKSYDELAFARLVARRYETDHEEFVVKPDALAIMDRMVWHLDEPFADASALPTWYVSRMARQSVTVALSGDGGDETFAGYVQRYAMGRLEDGIRRKIPDVLRRNILKPLGALYPRLDGAPRPLRLKRFLQNLSLSLEEAYCRDMAFYFQPEEKAQLYRPELKKQLETSRPQDVLLRHFEDCPSRDPVTRAQYVDIKTYLPEDILVKVDRMSMAHSLEVRAPILDHHIMEWAAKLASTYKLKGGVSKYIFKKMNEPRLPSDILYRKKHGFTVPLARWLRTDLRPMAEETLFSKDSGLAEYFQMETVRRLWDAHQSGAQDLGTPLWGLIVFEKWRRIYLEERSPGR